MPFQEFSYSVTDKAALEDGSIIIVPVFSDKTKNDSTELHTGDTLSRLNSQTDGKLIKQTEAVEFNGSAMQVLFYHGEPPILLAGTGKKDARPYRVLKAVSKTLSELKQKKLNTIFFDFSEIEIAAESAATVAMLAVAGFAYRSAQSKKPGPQISQVLVQCKGIEQTHLEIAYQTALAQSLTKDLVNTPPNLKNTRLLADTALSLPESIHVEVEEDVSKIEKEMPCFYSVARGSLSSDPPKFVEMHYKAPEKKLHIALIGKGVIFDTGGYQVKPGEFMNTMKADMTGAASVIGTMQAIGNLQPKHLSVSAYTALTPNMIDANAMVPDSIVDTTCGKKVEIRHTDAEGRLTLIDAVAVAAKKNPSQMITVATLTGSAGRAAGMAIALMTRPYSLSETFRKISDSAGEPVQTLEILEEDFEDIKSKLDSADINNTGNRKYRGAQTAAAFVMSGAGEEMPFIHLDIAGGDMSDDDKATGIAVPALIRYMLELDSSWNK